MTVWYTQRSEVYSEAEGFENGEGAVRAMIIVVNEWVVADSFTVARLLPCNN